MGNIFVVRACTAKDKQGTGFCRIFAISPKSVLRWAFLIRLSVVNHKVVDLSQHVNNALFYKQLMDQLEDSQQHFDKTVQSALSDALFSILYPK